MGQRQLRQAPIRRCTTALGMCWNTRPRSLARPSASRVGPILSPSSHHGRPPLPGLGYPHATKRACSIGRVGRLAPREPWLGPRACLYSELNRPSLWALTNDRRFRDGVIPRDPRAIAPSTAGRWQWLFRSSPRLLDRAGLRPLHWRRCRFPTLVAPFSPFCPDVMHPLPL